MVIFSTILSGVLIFVLGQIFLKIILEPIQNLKKTISNISHCLIHDYVVFQNSDMTEKIEIKEAKKRLRDLSARLNSDHQQIPFYEKFHKWFKLPIINNIYQASDKLHLLFNMIESKQADKHDYIDLLRKQASDLLDIHLPDKEPMSIIQLKENIRELRG